MFEKPLFVFLAVLIAGHCISIEPYSLRSEADQKLGTLKEIVNSAIGAATIELNADENNYKDYSKTVEERTKVEIGDQAETFEGYVADLQILANGKQCFGTVYRLDELQKTALQQLDSCLNNISVSVMDQIKTARETVLLTNSSVADLSFKLDACTGSSIRCVSPVLRSIQGATIELPETIEKQVHETGDLVRTITPQVDDCSKKSITSYTSDGNTIIDNISACVDM